MYNCLESICDSEGRVALKGCSGRGITVYQAQFVTPDLHCTQQFPDCLEAFFSICKRNKQTNQSTKAYCKWRVSGTENKSLT